MNKPSTPSNDSQLTDITGLRFSEIFPKKKEPSIRTLREWTKLRRIAIIAWDVVYFDPAEVSTHIREKLRVPARG